MYKYENKKWIKYATISSPKTLAYIDTKVKNNNKYQYKVYAYAKVVYRAMECKELSRIDFFVSGDTVYFNELNTIPGFTSASRYPSMLKEVGYSFTEIIRSVITLAVK